MPRVFHRDTPELVPGCYIKRSEILPPKSAVSHHIRWDRDSLQKLSLRGEDIHPGAVFNAGFNRGLGKIKACGRIDTAH